MKTVYIYGLEDPTIDEIRYVGKTTNLKNRLYDHIHTQDVNKHKKSWIASLIEIGAKPKMIILEKTNETEWEEREKYWIAYGREKGWRLTNIADGGMNNYYSQQHFDKSVLEPYLSEENKNKLDKYSMDELLEIAQEMINVSVDLMKGYFTGKTNGIAAFQVSYDYINRRVNL